MPRTKYEKHENNANENKSGIAENRHFAEVIMDNFGNSERQTLAGEHQNVAVYLCCNAVSQKSSACEKLSKTNQIGKWRVAHDLKIRRHPHGEVRIEAKKETYSYLQQLNNLIVPSKEYHLRQNKNDVHANHIDAH